MGDLTDQQQALVRAHLETIAPLLVPFVARYERGALDATPEGRALLKAPADLRPSLAIAALAGPRSGNTAAHVVEVPASEQWPPEVVRALVRRKISWEPADAALALHLVASGEFDDERVQLVVKAADRIAEVHPAHPDVVAALEELRQHVEATSSSVYRVPEMRARVLAAIARHSPPELLDLTPILDDDSWGAAAREELSAADRTGVDVVAVVALLTGAPSSTQPSERWLREAAETTGSTGELELVRRLVTMLVDLPLEDRPFVATGNDSTARAAVWALGHGAAQATDVRLLGRVALRCSQTNGKPMVTEALCGKAAGAAVTMLLRRRDEGNALATVADEELARLWDEVDRGDLLRRIGRGLGRTDAEIDRQLARAKRSKAARKAERVNPAPTARREHLASVIDEDVATRLANLGFVDRSGRTFRRHHGRSTDVVALSIADADVVLRFGIAYHDDGEQPSCGIGDLNLAIELALTSSDESADGYLDHFVVMQQDRAARRAARGAVDPLETLAETMGRFEAHALPALDRWARPSVLADDLEHLDVPFHHGTLLDDLANPNGPTRRRTIRRLRSLG